MIQIIDGTGEGGQMKDTSRPAPATLQRLADVVLENSNEDLSNQMPDILDAAR